MAQDTVITAIVPSLNQAGHLRTALESILVQEGDFHIDLVVVDGASSDGSVALLRKVEEETATGARATRCRSVSFRWWSEPDAGQATAINKGIAAARGDILAYVNSDDQWLPGAAAEVASHFDAHPQDDLVHGDGEVVGEGGALSWEWLSRPYDYHLLRSYHYLWNDFTNYIMQQATFWRRRVHDRIGGFDEAFHYSMDLEFWLRAGAAGLRFCHLPVKLARFRVAPGTKSTSSPVAFWHDNMEILRRHNRVGAMHRFFAFFYFNHARHAGFDLDAAFDAGETLFGEWESVPAVEQPALRRQAQRGFGLAAALLAAAAAADGRHVQARHFCMVAREKLGRAHPAPLAAGLYSWLSPSVREPLVAVWGTGVKVYRRRRYLYRYAAPGS